MDTREIAVAYRLTHWAGILRERQASGLSIRSYCKSEGICENVFYYWQRKLRAAACQDLIVPTESNSSEAMVPSGWAAVSGEGRNVDIEQGTIRIEIGRCQISVDGGASAEQLEKVCRVLMKLC